MNIKTIESKWRIPNIELSLSENSYYITINKIFIPLESRRKGTGTKIMNKIIEYANEKNLIIALTPTNDFGGNVNRLKKFYKSFGFVENKGRNRNFLFMQAMYKEPKNS